MVEPEHACDVELALGETVRCAGAACSLWHDGCTVAGLRSDLAARPELARLLRSLRTQLDALHPPALRTALPPGLRD